MKSRNDGRNPHETSKPRFKIEKLEARIAPKKGGIPGYCGKTGGHAKSGSKC